MAAFDAVYAAAIIGLCTLIYLGFLVYVLTMSIRNNYKLDIYILVTFGFIGVSMGLWFADYCRMAIHSVLSEEELVDSFYLDPFFFFCVGLLFYMCRLVLIVLAIKNMKTYKRHALVTQIVLIVVTVVLSALFGIKKYYTSKY